MFKMFRQKNKKARAGTAMQEIVGTFVVVMIVILFFISSLLFGLPSLSVEKLGSDLNEQIENHYSVLSMLNEKIKFEYDGKVHEIYGSDLVRLSETDENAKTILENQNIFTDELTFEGFCVSTTQGKIYIKKQESTE